MGASGGGVAFSRPPLPDTPRQVLEAIFGVALRPLRTIDNLEPRFDTRNPGDVLIAHNGRSALILNGDLSLSVLLGNGKFDGATVLAKLDMPLEAIFFGIFDSGDTYGFAMFRKGVLVRRRAISNGAVVENGDPLDVETGWKLTTAFSAAEMSDWGIEADDDRQFFRNSETGELIEQEGLIRSLTIALLKKHADWSPDDADNLHGYGYYRFS
jgi:hypothetical protein